MFWKKIRDYANKKVRRNHMDNFRHERKCPNCKLWTSEVGGCASIKSHGIYDFMKCLHCGYTSKWDCSSMIPFLSKDQEPHTPKI